jgi:hypothetical protein
MKRRLPADSQGTSEPDTVESAGQLRAWLTPPVVALGTGLLAFGALGLAAVSPWHDWPIPLRWALAVMFLLTASARLGPRRSDLVRMVPAGFPRPALLVAVTGLLEALGALGLVLPRMAPAAGWCLAALMVAMFPANVHAARSGGVVRRSVGHPARDPDRPAGPLRRLRGAGDAFVTGPSNSA